MAAFLGAWFIAFFRFFLPRVLFEPATVFKGYPADYALGIDEKYLQKYRIWVDRTPGRLFVIYARCTHLGALQIGSRRRTNSSSRATAAATTARELAWKNPAPRPMDRAQLELAPDGQIVVDAGHLYSWPQRPRS